MSNRKIESLLKAPKPHQDPGQRRGSSFQFKSPLHQGDEASHPHAPREDAPSVRRAPDRLENEKCKSHMGSTGARPNGSASQRSPHKPANLAAPIMPPSPEIAALSHLWGLSSSAPGRITGALPLGSSGRPLFGCRGLTGEHPLVAALGRSKGLFKN